MPAIRIEHVADSLENGYIDGDIDNTDIEVKTSDLNYLYYASLSSHKNNYSLEITMGLISILFSTIIIQTDKSIKDEIDNTCNILNHNAINALIAFGAYGLMIQLSYMISHWINYHQKINAPFNFKDKSQELGAKNLCVFAISLPAPLAFAYIELSNINAAVAIHQTKNTANLLTMLSLIGPISMTYIACDLIKFIIFIKNKINTKTQIRVQEQTQIINIQNQEANPQIFQISQISQISQINEETKEGESIESIEECGICIDTKDTSITKGEMRIVKPTTCQHTYHHICITTWLNQKTKQEDKTCPECKINITKIIPV
jgi:hypothetical protein